MNQKILARNFIFQFICLFTFTSSLIAAAGDLDSTFSQDGMTSVLINSNNGGSIKSTVIQPDGKIIAAGIIPYGDLDACGISRYNTDGSFDTSFGNGGRSFR